MYVGKTGGDLRARLNGHLRDSSNVRKRRWIQGLLEQGDRPVIEPIETIVDDCDNSWQEAERFWIENLRQLGCRLTNGHKGGAGGPSNPRSLEAIALSASWHRGKKRPESARINMRVKKNPLFGAGVSRRMTGYKHTEEAKLAMKLSKQNMSPEWRKKISISLKGKKHHWQWKIHLKNKGRPRSEETKLKLRLANLGKVHTEESRKKMSLSHTGIKFPNRPKGLNPMPHGTNGRYNSCRCADCKKAHAEYAKLQRAKARSRLGYTILP